MSSILFAAWQPWPWLPRLLNVIVLILSVLLIGLVLIQRGKGGGLVGALGGSGGSSAFGSRAGDIFTRYTIYLAAVWVLLIMILIKSAMAQALSVQPREGVTIQSGAPVEEDEGGE